MDDIEYWRLLTRVTFPLVNIFTTLTNSFAIIFAKKKALDFGINRFFEVLIEFIQYLQNQL